jgi:peptidyl-tRNA hydrolase, PTH1 family
MTEAIASNQNPNRTPEQILVVPQLIVGLGNPEPRYDQTRHNIGFAAVDAIARAWQIPLAENRKFQGIFGEGRSNTAKSHTDKIRLLKPLTYMNNSGQAIRAVTDWYKLPPESVLAIYDDMDLPLGKIRLRLSGSAGGHNGMKSAIAHLGTQNFPRLRIGIGRPQGSTNKADTSTISYVLGRFSSAQNPLVAEVLQMTLEAVELSLKQGVAQAMNRYNNRNIASNDKDTKQAVDN